MILKFWSNLYNLDGWKNIQNVFGDIIITFPFAVGSEAFTIYIDSDPNEDINYIVNKHEDWDHKDGRQLKCIIGGKLYDKIINAIIEKVEYYDLDADYKGIVEESEAELVKEYEEYDEE